MSVAFRIVRALRRLPLSPRLHNRLDHCAALDVFHRLGEDMPGLRIAHILGLVPLPSLYPIGRD